MNTMVEDKRILLDATIIDLPEESPIDYSPKRLEEYLPEGEQDLAKARWHELKQRNPQLTEEALKAILDWETSHGIFTRFNYERPSYGVDETGAVYGIYFHGKNSGVRALPVGVNAIPADFDVIAHVNNIEGDPRAYSLTFSPAVATQWFGNKLEVFLVPIEELSSLQDLYLVAQNKGLENKKTLGRLLGEKEFVMFGDPLSSWYSGTLEASMENASGIKQVNAESLGLLRNSVGLMMGDPNAFLAFLKQKNGSVKIYEQTTFEG